MKIVKIIGIFLIITSLAYSWEDPENLGSPPNFDDWDFQCSVDNDGDKIFFVTPNPIFKIHISEETGGSWSSPEVLPDKINNPGAEYPFWDESNSRLFFVEGGDIWYSDWNGGDWGSSSSWSTPTSVGSDVNSANDERSPCLSGGYLYFEREGDIYVADWNGSTASNDRLTGIGSGYPTSYHDGCLYFWDNRGGGQGGVDIWKAEGEGSNFSAAENLGPDVNSSHDDGSPSWTTVGWMYFWSDRPGGYGNPDLWRIDYNVSIQSTSLGVIKSLFE